MAFETIEVETRGHVRIVTFNRPERLNAISAALRKETHEAISAAREEDEIRAIIVTGKGRGFSSGADLSGPRPPPAAGGAAWETPTQNAKLDQLGWVGHWAKLFYECDKPVIAAVNGVAAGAGMSACLACDVRIGGRSARFKSTFVERNLSPDSGMSFFLPRIIGYARAADLIYTSRMVDAEEAYRLGLLDRLVDDDKLLDAAVAYANEMTRHPPLAVRMAKKVLQHNIEAELDDALKYESHGLSIARRATNDAKESFLSFQEKRPGKYTGT